MKQIIKLGRSLAMKRRLPVLPKKAQWGSLSLFLLVFKATLPNCIKLVIANYKDNTLNAKNTYL